MNPIPENLKGIAQIVKSYGTIGEVTVKFFDVLPDNYNEPVFIFFDEMPVPFFISSLTSRGSDVAIIKFESINTLSRADELAGRTLYSEASEHSVSDNSKPNDDISEIIGFTLIDGRSKQIGKIISFLNIPSNPCIEVQCADIDETVLIPLHEDLVVGIDVKEKIIQMNIPQGLI